MTGDLKSLDHVQLLSFPSHSDELGSLTVFEGGQKLPFEIARTFVVNAPAGSSRGAHAHRECLQLFVCLHGCVDVIVDDGREKRTIYLDNPTKGLFIPASIWAEQKYIANENVLMVLCDRGYEVEDYIRDYNEFVAFRAIGL